MQSNLIAVIDLTLEMGAPTYQELIGLLNEVESVALGPHSVLSTADQVF